ncbi:MAG: hypothetical protein IT379_28105 [Deltaproteobacteria bacterium]|nr:hypothetical protein [Deltaproteobacteria bacterium]
MKPDQTIVVYTSCQDVADFVARFANRVSTTGLRLPNAVTFARGAAVRFEVRLADGTAALRGEGTVIDVSDRGSSVAAPLRYELMVAHLRLDARNEVVYERILMLHESAGEPATGEVDLHEVEQSADDGGYDAPAMSAARPPPAPPRSATDPRGRSSAPPPRGSVPPPDARGSVVPAPPAARSPSGIPSPLGRSASATSGASPRFEAPSRPMPASMGRPIADAAAVGPGSAGAGAPGQGVPAPRPSSPGTGPALRRPAIGPSLPPRPSGPPRPAAATGGRFAPAAAPRPSAPRASMPGPPTSRPATPVAAPVPEPAAPVAEARAPAPVSPVVDAAPVAAPAPAPARTIPHESAFAGGDEDAPTSAHVLPSEPRAMTASASSAPPPPLFEPPRIYERDDTSDDLAPVPHDMAATTPGVVLDGVPTAGGLPRFGARTGPSGTIAGGTIPSATLPEETHAVVQLPGGRPISIEDASIMDGATRQLSLDEADRLVRATRPSAPAVQLPGVADDDVDEETHGEGLDGPTMRHDVRNLPSNAPPVEGDDE